MDDLLTNFGYVGILVGSFLEGETIVIAAGYLAHQGYLKLPWVVVFALAGTLAGDQLYYYIGLKRGAAFLEKRPNWAAKSERILRLLDRHQNLVIVAFRFLYGMRTITPFLIGLSRVSPLKYTLLNFLGALVWSVAIAGAGYLLGHSFELVLDDVKRYELLVIAAVGVVGACVWLIAWWRRSPR